MDSNPYDIAYLAGFDDGMETVGNLTVRIYVLTCMLLVSITLNLYLIGKVVNR